MPSKEGKEGGKGRGPMQLSASPAPGTERAAFSAIQDQMSVQTTPLKKSSKLSVSIHSGTVKHKGPRIQRTTGYKPGP